MSAAGHATDPEKYECTLTPDLVEKARKELNEKPEWRARDIQALRDMVNAHPGLHCRTDDAFLLRFLRAGKFDYDRAYQLLLNYYQIRAENPDVFKNLKPSDILPPLDVGVSTVLPRPDKEGRRIIYFRPGKWDPDKFSIYQILRTNVINLELIIQDEETQVNGVLVLGNMTDMGINHAKAFERNYAKLTAAVLQDAFPMRLKGMRLVNEPTIIGYIFNIIKPFMKEKLQGRLAFYGSDIEKLHQDFDPAILPEELGGELPHGDVIAVEWKKTLLAKEDYYEDQLKYYLDIPRQIMKKTTDEAVECLAGTYRKLNID